MIHDFCSLFLQTVEAYDILEQMTGHESVNFTNIQPQQVRTAVYVYMNTFLISVANTFPHTTDPFLQIPVCDTKVL